MGKKTDNLFLSIAKQLIFFIVSKTLGFGSS